MPFAFCSSKECKHSQKFGPLYNAFGEINDNIPAKKFCAQCGEPMIAACQNCNSPREQMSDKFCPDCGKLYK